MTFESWVITLVFILLFLGITTWILWYKDWFKSKPYWLRGGIIGGIISLLLTLLATICFIRFPAEAGLVCLILPLGPILPEFFFGYIQFEFVDFSAYFSDLFYVFLMHITSFIILFLIGAFAGQIIGKIKSK